MARRAFTLAELMVAVAVLLVVIVATAKIFGTATQVTGVGEAASDVIQEAAAIERQYRADFKRLSREGFFAIRCVAVRNDHNLPGGALLDANQPPDSWIRADQLVFFTQGLQSVETYRQGSNVLGGAAHKGQSTAARVYYGHAVQFPEAPPIEPGYGSVLAIDPDVAVTQFVPWFVGPGPFVKTRFRDSVGAGEYDTDYPLQVDCTQPPAPRWLLARHVTVLADDGGEPTVFLGHNRSAPGIADPVIQGGRVDAAAQQLDDIRQLIELDQAGGYRSWTGQRDAIASQMYYPRAERVAPGMHRVDQALTNHAIGSACSSFAVDWTYGNGVGDAVNADGTPYRGARIDASLEQPWYGLDALGRSGDGRGVLLFVDYAAVQPDGPPETIFPANTERLPPTGSPTLILYEAYFGYNRDAPFLPAGASIPDPLYGTPDANAGFTPWPTAIRITMTLHDTDGKLQAGRRVQFVIDLPRRGD